MTIAEQIYEEVRKLPDEPAREVLDFVGFIAAKYALKPASERDLQPAKRLPRTPGSAAGKLTVLMEDDEHLKDFQDYMGSHLGREESPSDVRQAKR